jgi:hypothetical protein
MWFLELNPNGGMGLVGSCRASRSHGACRRADEGEPTAMTIWQLLDPWLPWVHIWRMQASLRPVDPSQDDIDALAKSFKRHAEPALAAEAASLVSAET